MHFFFIERLLCIRSTLMLSETVGGKKKRKKTVHSCSGMSKVNDLRVASNEEQPVQTVLYIDRWEIWCSVTKEISLFFFSEWPKNRRSGIQNRERWCGGELKQGRGRKSRASWPQLVWHQSNSWFLPSSQRSLDTYLILQTVGGRHTERGEGLVKICHEQSSDLKYSHPVSFIHR